jgi:NAD-dependent dihydropyrimidine dehydrogenase PreA subunit
MYRIDEVVCTGCGDCVETCPAGAIALAEGRAHIDPALCVECSSCADACPQGAIVMAIAPSPAYTAIRPATSPSLVAPATVTTEPSCLAYRPELEVLPAEPRRGGFWLAVGPLAGSLGSALAWAARELLPAALRAWEETSRWAERPLATGRSLANPNGGAGGWRQNRRRYGKRGRARNRAGRL